MNQDPRALLRAMFDAAIAAALPEKSLAAHLPPPPKGRTLVVGCGKAAASMAKAVEDHWKGELSGLVVTRYGHKVPARRIEVVEAAHPVPDAAGRAAADRMLRMVQGLSADDLVIFLASGGGSALLALPAPGLTLEDKIAVTDLLLRSGAAIGEVNTVRKHLSRIKGGQLAVAAAPARLAVSYKASTSELETRSDRLRLSIHVSFSSWPNSTMSAVGDASSAMARSTISCIAFISPVRRFKLSITVCATTGASLEIPVNTSIR